MSVQPSILSPNPAPPMHVWWVASAMVALFGVFLGWGSFRQYESTLEQEFRAVEAQARLGDALIAGALRSIDLVLQGVLDDEQAGALIDAEAKRMRHQSFLRQFPEIQALVIADEQGQVRSAESEVAPESLTALRSFNVTPREFFRFHREAQAKDWKRTHLSRQFQAVSKRYLMTVSRALRDRDGRFRGVVLVSISPQYFEAVLKQVLSKNEAIDAAAVHNREGDIIYRLPEPASYVGRNIADGESFRTYLNSTDHLVRYVGVARTDGRSRVLVFSRVGDTSLDVGVSAQVDRVMAEWRYGLRLQVLSFAVVTVLIFLLAWQVQRRLQLRWAQEQVERRFHAYFERSMVGMVTLGSSGQWMDVNPALCNMLGGSPVLIRQQAWADWLHPDDRLADAAQHAQLASGEIEEFEAERRLVRSDGHLIDVRLAARALRKPDRSLDYVVMLVDDISKRKQAERQMQEAMAHSDELNKTLEARVAQRTAELEQTAQRLEQSREALAQSEARATLSTLIAGVSHELGTPLGNSHMVAASLKDQAEELRRHVQAGSLRRSELESFLAQLGEGTDLMQHNLQRAVSLLADFKQVAVDQASEVRRRFVLSEMVAETLHALSPSLRGKPFQIEVHIPSSIQMDSQPGPLSQVVINLVNNASVHAFEGRESGVLRISAVLDGSWVRLIFSDDGKGMTPEQMEKMYDPFFSTKMGQGGSGLGMAIVKNIVTKTLGGQISVRSAVGEGSTFTVELPTGLEELLAPAAPLGQVQWGGQGI